MSDDSDINKTQPASRKRTEKRQLSDDPSAVRKRLKKALDEHHECNPGDVFFAEMEEYDELECRNDEGLIDVSANAQISLVDHSDVEVAQTEGHGTGKSEACGDKGVISESNDFQNSESEKSNTVMSNDDGNLKDTGAIFDHAQLQQKHENLYAHQGVYGNGGDGMIVQWENDYDDDDGGGGGDRGGGDDDKVDKDDDDDVSSNLIDDDEREEFQQEFENIEENHDNEHEQNNMFSLSKLLTMTERLTLQNYVTSMYAIIGTIAMAVRGRLTHVITIVMLRFLNRFFVQDEIPCNKKGLWSTMLRNDKDSMNRHMYCGECTDYLGIGRVPEKSCNCGACGLEKSNKRLRFFIEVKIGPQLKELFSNPSVIDDLQYRFTRVKNNPAAIEDVYDGKKYLEKCEPGEFLANRNNFSFTIFTDGVQVSKSSKASAWPVFLQMNELSPQARKRYVILAGIWVDNVHANMNMILRPTILELNELYTEGIKWRNHRDHSLVTSKFITLICTADSVARPDILRMMRFNGRYGCTFCLADGVSIVGHQGKRSQLKYPLPRSGDTVECRNDQQMRLAMEQAHASNNEHIVKGVKGISALYHLPEFDLACNVIVDSMHCLFMGVAKFHTELLLDKKYFKEAWYAGRPKQLAVINAKISKIRFPNIISRSPRNTSEMSTWKASEWRNWIQFVAPIALKGTIHVDDLLHIEMLSSASFILNNGTISTEELESARTLLEEYVKKFQRRFGRKHMRYNIHLLNHITDTVEYWGPFWSHNAFNFESWNKKIIDKVTAANARPLQIVTRYFMTRFVENIFTDSRISDEMKDMVNSILTDDSRKREYITDHTLIPDKCTGIGTSEMRRPDQLESEALLVAGHGTGNMLSYKNATIHGINFRRRLEKKDTETLFCNMYVYSFDDDLYGEIQDIVQLYHGGEIIWGLFVEPMDTVGDKAHGTTHIQIVKFRKTKVFVTIGNKPLFPAMVLEQDGDQLFVTRIPNCNETD